MDVVRSDGLLRSLESSRAQIARIYDHLLGGAHNFAVDRAAGDRLKRLFPLGPQVCLANRAFLLRTVRSLAANGIGQFLDLGCGIPSARTVHEAAQTVNPAARVVYVDHEPVAVMQTRTVLADNEQAAAIHADLRRPSDVLRAPEIRRLLDFDQPVAVLLGAVLHYVGDDAHSVLAHYSAGLAPGSALLVTHFTADDHPDLAAGLAEIFATAGAAMHTRSRAEVAGLFDGFRLSGRGVDYLPEWCPDVADERLVNQPTLAMTYGAVGHKL